MRRFNRWLAIKITSAIGTMACAYVFALIALVSLPAALSSGSVIVIVGWVAQTFLQLVLLSVIMVGQNVQSDKTDGLVDKTAGLVEKHDQLVRHHLHLAERIEALHGKFDSDR